VPYLNLDEPGTAVAFQSYQKNTVKGFTNDFADRIIVCVDCKQDFVWTSGEQIFFRDKGLQNPPKRCKACKQAKNERITAIAQAQAAGIKQKIEVAVNCAGCGVYTTVPFYPSQNRPVYCRSCFLLKTKAE